MPDASTLILFALASLVLVVVPGPAVIYILTRSISQGRSAGVASAFGVNAGTAVHVVAAVVGLSVIIANSAAAFGAIKWAGVAYLVWLGFKTITADDTTFAEPQSEPVAIKRIFAQGVVVNLLNPKVAVFMLAFLPQFIDPTDPNATFQTFVLGMTLVAIGLMSDLVYALVGGGIGDLFRKRPGAARTTRRVAGMTYFALAGVAAFTGTRN
jgi:threonine/homoserine/homoserine lactone efflux protein